MSVLVKICGVTRTADAEAAVRAGADMVGVVFAAESPRCVGLERARELLSAASGAAVVGVFTDEARAREVSAVLPLDYVQIYGDHDGLPNPIVATRGAPPDGLDASLPLLLDLPRGARPTAAELRAHWRRAAGLDRRVVVAGALDAGNVAAAVAAARPWAVDTARGVESAPGVKDHGRVERFVAAAREADGG